MWVEVDVDEASKTLKMIAADVPDRGRMYYLVDGKYDFISDAKEFLDWKAATKRAPATMKAYCSRLLWYYRFLSQRNLSVLEAAPADLTEFVIWLCNPYRDVTAVSVIHQPSPLTAASVNLILQVAGAFYHFLVRRGKLAESPVRYVDVPRGNWLTERDLLAHTGRGRAVIQRMELKLKEPDRFPPTVSEQDFQTFIDSIHMGESPNGDPSGFRDRLLCLLLKEIASSIYRPMCWACSMCTLQRSGLKRTLAPIISGSYSKKRRRTDKGDQRMELRSPSPPLRRSFSITPRNQESFFIPMF